MTFQFKNVVVRRKLGDGERVILNGVSTNIDAPITVISGPSGAGKTTFIRLLNGLDSANEGTVLFHGEEVAELDPMELRRKVGFVAQQPAALAATGHAELQLAAQLAGVAFDDAVLGFCDQIEIRERLDQNPADLSVGERQRLAIVRALAAKPEVLVLDEPTSAQDERRAKLVHEMLASSGAQLIIVEHRFDALTPGYSQLKLREGSID